MDYYVIYNSTNKVFMTDALGWSRNLNNARLFRSEHAARCLIVPNSYCTVWSVTVQVYIGEEL